jgi:small GTP-binding protein
MSNYDFTWKIMMLGDKDAGKTSLTIRFISGFFLEDIKLTIGLDFYSKTTNYSEKKVKLQIWDFGGEERFRFLLHQYCKGANAAFFLYNITIPRTLDHLPEWIQIIREHAGDIPIMLVGTNVHLKEQRAVTREQDIQAARLNNLSGFIEVSSKTGQNVEKLFDLMTEILFDRYKPDGMKTGWRYPKFKVNKSINFGLKNDKAYQKRIEELQGLSFIGEILAFDLAKLGVSKESFLKWNKKDLMDYKKLIKQNYKSTLSRAFNNRS